MNSKSLRSLRGYHCCPKRTQSFAAPVRRCVPLALALVLWVQLAGAQSAHWFTPVPDEGQRLTGSSSGAVGLGINKVQDGLQIVSVAPKSPGGIAGLKPGDMLIAMDGKDVSSLDSDSFPTMIASMKPGSHIAVAYSRNGVELKTSLTIVARGTLDPTQAKIPLGVGQSIFDQRGAVVAVVGQMQDPHFVTVSLRFENWKGPAFQVDDAKFFALDGDGHQLTRWTLEQMKYSAQLWMAENQKGTEYALPPPPPQPRSFEISGTENGTYRLSPGMITGTSTQTYSVEPNLNDPQYQMAQAAYGLQTLLLSIRQYRDRKYNEKLFAAGQQELNTLDGTYFRSESPVIPGENREGSINYGSAQGVKPPFKVVLILLNPVAGKEETVSFKFQ